MTARRCVAVLLFVSLLCVATDAWGIIPGRRVPTVEDLLRLKQLGAAQISPDGKWIAYGISHADLKQDAYITQLWLVNTDTGKSVQLTRGEKSSGNPNWSPDSKWLGFTTIRNGDKSQIYAISPEGGEAVQLTKAENGVNDFEWAPDGKTIAFTATHTDKDVTKNRQEHLGDYTVVRKEYQFAHLYTIDVAEAFESPAAGKERTKGKEYSVTDFDWSPDSTKIAFSATINPDLIHILTADIFVLNLADNTVKKIVSQPGADIGPRWSPDGKEIVFRTGMGKVSFHHNPRLAIVPADGGTPRSITDDFDEAPSLIEWKKDGIYFGALQKTAAHLFRLDPATTKITRISTPDTLIAGGFSLSHDGTRLAFTSASPTSITELYVTDTNNFAPKKLTDMTKQTAKFILGKPEVISWKSKDGAEIEGVLLKPADFDPNKKHPLLCVIHGGPTGIDRPTLLSGSSYYPTDLWAGRGALVLRVNYRGSAGYGQKFRQLNVRNLGVGDAWDVISGVDHLIEKGWVDPSKVACMGWSQGGYISAFLSASSDRFAAISVGAGISNWATYYYNTDITQFTLQYLGKDPIDDPEIYRTTSPMSYIQKARTPTLIQHGENDRRVPIANAYELRQGLEDRHVKVEMIVYKGFGHGITKPRAMRAVMIHNLHWFNHHLWGDPLPDFANPDVPKKDKDKEKEVLMR